MFWDLSEQRPAHRRVTSLVDVVTLLLILLTGSHRGGNEDAVEVENATVRVWPASANVTNTEP